MRDNMKILSMVIALLCCIFQLCGEESDVVTYSFVNEQQMPLVIAPKDPGLSLAEFQHWAETHQLELKTLVAKHGAVLFRDFSVQNADDFAAVFQAVLGRHAMDYLGGEGSRTKVKQGVYTSTEAPAWAHIPLHHELSCTDRPSSYICFYCNIAPAPGSGQTLLGDTERVTQAILQHPDVWDLFQGKIIKYISRHPPEGSLFATVNVTHRTWQSSFETQDPLEVERICQAKGFEFHWLGDWIEVIRRAPAVKGPDDTFDHPYWYNQAHLYHGNPRIRGGWLNHLLANALYINSSTRQYDVEFEDGSMIPREIIYQIYDVLEQETILFDWKEGDVLIVDNKRALHGRAPYEGKRRILAAMIP